MIYLKINIKRREEEDKVIYIQPAPVYIHVLETDRTCSVFKKKGVISILSSNSYAAAAVAIRQTSIYHAKNERQKNAQEKEKGGNSNWILDAFV